MKTYRVYFNDHNVRLYGGSSISMVLDYIVNISMDYTNNDIVKVEEVK